MDGIYVNRPKSQIVDVIIPTETLSDKNVNVYNIVNFQLRAV